MMVKTQLLLSAVLLVAVAGAEIEQIRRIVTIEDHPWVIKSRNATCLAQTEPKPCKTSCYSGLLIDLLHKLDTELKNLDNCTIHEADSIGYLDKSVSPHVWTGIFGEIANNKSDLALAALNISTEAKNAVQFSYPFINKDKKYGRNKTFALAFPKGGKSEKGISHLIKKLINQRHIEQMLEIWFNESRDAWTDNKTLTPF